ncbi:rhamnan synthesis F family protein [Tateyamaria sp. ANG-S1]|uniref:rhamnan synthesis F family protein n=1 Tax=Tateyamaria sp. ANG-S1 TaxID=1577905 RepID=UPI0009E4BB2A|nr:rhamnan synthesis F family protein [Tateyamaria sp. ANG-S1]
MPPLWKIRRELLRLISAPVRGATELVRSLYLRRYYDGVLARRIKRHQGVLPLGPEIGIYLIFPSNGVLPSHLRMLREMVASGISPFVVSNQPLSDTDRMLLTPLSAWVLERPNVGYDFGGYRDGVLEIADQLPSLSRLWLINDSVWLVPQKTSWFDDARTLGVDFVGATSNFAMPRVDPEKFREIKWSFSVHHRNFHYASYALGIGQSILQHPGFLRYWKQLEIRNDKSRTVRRGEIGLSQWVLKRGFSHGATYEVECLDAELTAMNDFEIDQIASDLIIPSSPRLEAERQRVLKSIPTNHTGRKDRIAIILSAVSRQASGYVLPGYSLRRRGFQFLKKSPLAASPQVAQSMHKLISRIEGEAGAEIYAEAQLISESQGYDRV